MNIREYTPSDYDGVCEISRHIWGGHDYLPFMITKYYEDKYSIPIIIEDNGEIVSVANTRLISPEIAWLEAIRTHPKARGKGYGYNITKAQLNSARKLGAIEAQLLTSVENTATRKILDRLEFQETHLYYLWGWRRNNFDEYEDSINNELDREGKLISINHLPKHVSHIGDQLKRSITEIKTAKEVQNLALKIDASSYDSLVLGDYQTYPWFSPNIETWLDKGLIFKIDDPMSIITIQESKESRADNVSFSVGVTSIDPRVIESAMLYTLENYTFNHIELMFSQKLEHRLFSIPEFRFRLMRKIL